MTKPIEYYLGLPYTIELRPDPEVGWFVHVQELPGCMSQADTADAALANIREVMPLWIETALEDGYEIPEPRPPEDYSGKFVARIPRSLHRELVERAQQEDVSLNQFVSAAMARAVGQVLTTAHVPDDLSWPGLKSSLWRVLAAAGASEDAGQIDESLFANWTEQMLGQVEAAVAGGYEREALTYLGALENALSVGGGHSAALRAFRHTVQLLTQQVTACHSLQQEMISQNHLLVRIIGFAEQANTSVAAALIREEQVTYGQQRGRMVAELDKSNWLSASSDRQTWQSGSHDT
jgi:antitoxin HicB